MVYISAIVGKLTQEETVEMLGEVISNLPEDVMFEALGQALTTEQKAECVARWEEEEPEE